MKRVVRRFALLFLCLCMFFSLPTQAGSTGDLPLKEKFTYGKSNDTQVETLKYQYYTAVKKSYAANKYKPAKSDEIVIEPKNIRLDSAAKALTQTGTGNRTAPSFTWKEQNNWVEWDFSILSEGLYEIEIEYYMLPGSGNPGVRSFSLDGNIPFMEANNIVFDRLWTDEGNPVVNSIGDEARPKQIEVAMWNKKVLSDSLGWYSEPFSFYFKPGSHVLRLNYIDQPMAIGNVTVRPAREIPGYEKVKEEYQKKGYKDVSQTFSFQAENTAIQKNDPTIRRENDGDPSCQPASSTNRLLNVIGGSRWKKGNQSVTWKFNVPEDGLYKLGVRYAQLWNDGLPSYRQIAIDGAVPFSELQAYRFPYGKSWNLETLRDSKNNEPYLFYLTKGEHTITMSAKMGPLTEVIQSLNDDALLLSGMILDITKLTGNNPDPNYDYEFFNRIPTLKNNMETLMNSLQKKYDLMKSMSGKTPAMANNFMTIKSQLGHMVKDPFSIAGRMNELNNAMNNLGTWYLNLQNQPLLIDYFQAGAKEDKWKNEQAGVLKKLAATFANFFVSFQKDYDNVGSYLNNDIKINSTINVWVARGTEWAELIKEMADEDFTPKTGIAVNINILPASQIHAGNVNALMLSITSGKAPDVAFGVSPNDPVEFAIRDAALDLSKFKDFNEVSKRFIPSVLIPYKYRGGVYAIPETMDFSVMFYRKDIVKDLGIKIPDTRDELYNYVLPALYQNGLQFYYPHDATQFIFQHNADFYTPDGKRSGLDTPEAYRAFKEYTELFTNYGFPVVASLFNRMRTGEIPMGIGNYGMYMQLSVAAPELAGRWGIAPLPGMKKPDGTVDRSNGALTGQGDIILKSTKHPEESWEFLKWWTSTAVQTQFARELEAMIGTEARWNTANLEAFDSLAWKREDLNVIHEQWKWAKETPVVLGGYFTGRHITNAWNSVVIGGKTVRDALEKAVEDINRELRMKQEEYGVFDSQR